MKKSVAIVALLVGCVSAFGQRQEARDSCKTYMDLASTVGLAQLEILYKRLVKSSVVEAIYAERLYAFNASDRDLTLLRSLPKNGEELQRFYNVTDCAHDVEGAARLTALQTSFGNYFIDASKAVVRHPQFMVQFVRVYTQFNSTPVDNVDLSEQMCPIGAYVYLHRRSELLSAVAKIGANPNLIPHKSDECP
ncbi:MAG: hypothetical protein ABSD67_07140 [Terracidiphilus sp.]|jgi:hypothetical protein